MLIALFSMLAIAIFGSGESPFLIPKVDKKIKKVVVDDERKTEILAIMKGYKKEWKILAKTKKKQAKSFKKLNKDRNADPEELAEIINNGRKQREGLNEKLIAARIKVAGLITDEEWNEIMNGVLEVKTKTTKKLTKAETKARLKQDKRIEAIGDEIEAAFSVPAHREEATKYLIQFEEDIIDLLVGSQNHTYKDQEILRNRLSTEEEIDEIIQQLENFRSNVHYSFLELRKDLVELSTEDNWPKLAKALGKLIKK